MPTLANIIKNIDPPIELTATEYNALTTQQKNDGTVYYVTDGDESVIYKSGVAYGVPASDLPFELGIENGVYGYYTTGGTFVGFKNPTGNAAQKDVLSGKTFANATSDSLTGTMPNNGAVSPAALNCNGSYTIPAGYHNGSGVVTANTLAAQTTVDDGKTAATAATIRSGYQAWVNGNKISGSMATLTSANFSGSHSSTVAGAASNYVTKSSAAGYVASGTSVNTLAAGTSPTISTTAATGTKTINVKPGYYNKISVNQTSAYNAGLQGILSGMTKVAHVSGENPAFSCTNGHTYFVLWALESGDDPTMTGGTFVSKIKFQSYNQKSLRSTGHAAIIKATSTKITITNDTNGDLYWKRIS